MVWFCPVRRKTEAIMKSLAMVPREKIPEATRDGPAHRQDDPEEGGGAVRALDRGRLLDLLRQVLEVGREHPHAEGQGHRRIDEEEGQEVVVQSERDHHLVERDEEDGLRNDVGGEDRAPPPPEAGWPQAAQGVGRGDTHAEGGHHRAGKDEEGVREPVQEGIRAAEGGPHEATEPRSSRSNSSSKLSRVGFTTMNGFPKTSSLGVFSDCTSMK